MKKLVVLLIILLPLSVLQSQNLTFFGFLPAYSETGLISKKIDYNIFISTTYSAFSRTYDQVNYPPKFLQYYIQPSIIYKVSPNWNIAASVTYNYQRNNPNSNYFKEWRPWQQVVYSHTLFNWKGRLSHRLRFEERIIKNLNDIWRLTTRLRYQIGYMVPLQGKTLDVHEFYFNCYNEFYFTTSNPSSRPRNAFYGENWTYVGIGYNCGKLGRIEIGPLYQAAYRDRQHDRRNLALLQTMWITNFQ